MSRKAATLFGKVDHALSSAEYSLGSIANFEAKTEEPENYALASEIYDEIEAMRWRIRKHLQYKGRK